MDKKREYDEGQWAAARRKIFKRYKMVAGWIDPESKGFNPAKNCLWCGRPLTGMEKHPDHPECFREMYGVDED